MLLLAESILNVEDKYLCFDIEGFYELYEQAMLYQ